MKKLDLSIYPTPLEIKNLFYLDSAGELRWKTDHLRNKAGDNVTFYLEKDRSLRLRYWSKKSRKFHLISGAIIVWVLVKGELPSERGIFSLNGDNTDLSFANWAEQDVTPVKIDASNIKEFVYYNERRECSIFCVSQVFINLCGHPVDLQSGWLAETVSDSSSAPGATSAQLLLTYPRTAA